jgi:hypothetical protein
VASWEHAERLDPRSPDPPGELAGMYDGAGRFADALRSRAREIAFAPDNVYAHAWQAASNLLWRADTAAARRALEQGIQAGGASHFVAAMLVRIPDVNVAPGLWEAVLPPTIRAARDTLTYAGFAAIGDTTRALYHFMKLRHFARTGRAAQARAHADSIVALLEPAFRHGDELGTAVALWFTRAGMLAEAYTYAQRPADAIRVLDRYIPAVRRTSSIAGRDWRLCTAAYPERLAGRADSAVARLGEALRSGSRPCVSRALLRADPSWAPLRGNPGFERLLAGL